MPWHSNSRLCAPVSYLCNLFSVSPLGAEVRPRGHSAPAPSEAAGALGHRRDLPHTPWNMRVCVSFPAPPLSRSRLAHASGIIGQITLSVCKRLHIITATQHAMEKKATTWLQLLLHTMTFVLESKHPSFLCTPAKPKHFQPNILFIHYYPT